MGQPPLRAQLLSESHFPPFPSPRGVPGSLQMQSASQWAPPADPSRAAFFELPETLFLFDGPVGKESACNAGDLGLIPRLGRSAGEGVGYPLQYSWASLVAQLVKNPPAMWEAWVRSLGWEDPLEKGTATHSSILAWRIPWTSVHGVSKSQTWQQLSLSLSSQSYLLVTTPTVLLESWPQAGLTHCSLSLSPPCLSCPT